MRVVFCYATAPHPKALRALDMHAPGAERVDTSGDPTNYWREIALRWDGSDDLVLIEQDNEITRKVLPSFAACDQDWCTYAYDGLFGKLEQSLGCTKFSAALQRRFPADMIAGPGMVWHLIDFRIGKLFGMHGVTCHVHGSVSHYHDYARDPLQRRNVIRNADSTFTVTERQPDGSLRVWENCTVKPKRGTV
jgi:hypothetical protein